MAPNTNDTMTPITPPVSVHWSDDYRLWIVSQKGERLVFLGSVLPCGDGKFRAFLGCGLEMCAAESMEAAKDVLECALFVLLTHAAESLLEIRPASALEKKERK